MQEALDVGSVITSRFEVISKLGSSVVGDSYLVKDLSNNSHVVLKRFAFFCDNEDERASVAAQIEQEIQRIAHIESRSLVTLHGLLRVDSSLFLVLEYIDGEPLDVHLQVRREKGQILGLKSAYSLIAHICLAMEQVHASGLFHGALTPNNIFVTKQGRVKVSNLAYSFFANQRLNDGDRAIYFNNRFVAPEHRLGREYQNPSMDVYSLGMLMGELLSSVSLAESGLNDEEFIHNLSLAPDALKSTLLQSVYADPSLRIQDVSQFKEALKSAFDAPTDDNLSSIVLGVQDLRALSASADLPAARDSEAKPDLFDRSRALSTISRGRNPDDEEVWLVQKDGLDYGPFTKQGVLDMLYRDEIHEGSSTLNMSTQIRMPLGKISLFQAEVEAYLPVREQKRADQYAERERKIQKVKRVSAVSTAGIVIGVGVVIAISVIAYLNLPDPVALNFEESMVVFPKEFEAPKIEEVSLNVDANKAKALFDPKASAEEREAALRAWEAEHRKKFASRRSGAAGARRPGGAPEDEIHAISFTDEDGKELTPLKDWEIEEQLYSSRMLRRQSDCFLKYAGGRRQKVTVDFVIAPSGQIRSVSTTAGGVLSECLVSSFSTMRFRQFGGSIKKVSYPIDFN